MKNKMIVVMAMAIIAAGMFLIACGGYRVAGMAPGMKIQIRSGSPAPRGSDLAAPTGVPDPDFNVESNISDSGSKSKLASVSTSALTTNPEELVKEVLYKSEQTWNEKDTENYLNLFSEDARIMVGRNQKIVTKKDYIKMFPAAFDEAGKVKYKNIDVEILDSNNARAKGVAYISADKNLIWLTKKLHLINQNGKWLISESTFEIYFRGDVDPRNTSRPRSGGESL